MPAVSGEFERPVLFYAVHMRGLAGRLDLLVDILVFSSK